MYTIYAIASLKRKYRYVGMTANLEQRLIRHNEGLEKTTKPYAPYLLIFTEEAENRTMARKREKFFKSRTGKRLLYKIIAQNFSQLPQYL